MTAPARRVSTLVDVITLVADGRRPVPGIEPDIVAQMVAVIYGDTRHLDWRGASSAGSAACYGCRRQTFLRDPYLGEPWHKVCVEDFLREWGPNR